MIYKANNVGLEANYYYTGSHQSKTYKCKHCASKFEVREGNYIYKLNNFVFCSYTCRTRHIKANKRETVYRYEFDKGSFIF